MKVLNVYRFVDGYTAYFICNDKINHILQKPDEIMTFDKKVEGYKIRLMKIKYGTWLKLIKRKSKLH